MKHLSKEEFKRRVVAFSSLLSEELKNAQSEAEKPRNTFYEYGVVVGKIQAFQMVQKVLKQEFGLDD